MKTTPTNVQLADGFATSLSLSVSLSLPLSVPLPLSLSRVGGTGALAGWRHVQAPACGVRTMFSVHTYALAAGGAGAASSPASAASGARTRNPLLDPAQLPVIAALPVVTTAAVPAMTKQHLVTTQGAGRGNEGSSPWKVPV